MFGLVDYEDEEDDIPMNLGSNGKDGGEVFEKESDSLLTSIPLSDPIWSNLEDSTVAKRKLPPAPDLVQNDAVVSKRQKPETAQASERSNDLGNLTSIDELASSTRGAEVLESAELIRKCSQVPTSPERLASRSESSKVFPYEEPMSAQLPGNGTVLDSDLHPVTKPNHDGGDSCSSVNVETAGDLVCANGKLNTLPRCADCSSMVANNLGRTANGSGNAVTEKISEVSTSSVCHEDPNLHNGTSSLNGALGENGVNADDALLNIIAEGCTSENGVDDSLGQDCNGTANDGVKREGLGTGSIKGSGVSQELSNGSLESENKKLISLSTDLLRAVTTPTSPGPFTVR